MRLHRDEARGIDSLELRPDLGEGRIAPIASKLPCPSKPEARAGQQVEPARSFDVNGLQKGTGIMSDPWNRFSRPPSSGDFVTYAEDVVAIPLTGSTFVVIRRV